MESARVFLQTVIDDAAPCHHEAETLFALQCSKPSWLNVTEAHLDLPTESQPLQL